MNVLARTVRRAAGDVTFEGILRLEHHTPASWRRTSLWREAQLPERAVRWVWRRIIFTAVFTAALSGTAIWYPYTDNGRFASLGMVAGQRWPSTPG